MSQVQLKPYLDVRRIGDRLRIGHMPPRGIEIEDAPAALDRLIALLSQPISVSEASQALAALGDLQASEWRAVIEQLVEAGVVGEVIPDLDRYARHWLYYDLIGIDPRSAQQRLHDSKVAVVGSGGIGSNVATVLAAAGVGRLVLTDGDRIELSNLTRQFLYDESCLGDYKVDAAARRLRLLNSATRVDTLRTPATRELFLEKLGGCDMVIVSADSPDELHEWVDEGARRHGYGYLAAGYIEAHGSVGPLVLPGTTACYTCMRAQGELNTHSAGNAGTSRNLNRRLQAASFGPLNLTIAATAANEALRLLIGGRCETAGRRLLIDSQTYGITTEDFERLPTCAACSALAPDIREGTALDPTSLEDVYAEARSEKSINAVVLDSFLHDLADVRAGDAVLDFGCGTGEQAMRLAHAGALVTAYDPSADMLATLDRRLPGALRPTLQFTHEIDVAAKSAPFDLIMCTNVLDHIGPETIELTISWLRAQIAPFGRIVLTVPHPIKDGASWIRSGTSDGWEYHEMRLHDYFEEGPMTKHRETADGMLALRSITTQHRTLATYAELLASGGLEIVGIHEPQPPDEAHSEYPEIWAKTSRVPYFLTFVLRPLSRPPGRPDRSIPGEEER